AVHSDCRARCLRVGGPPPAPVPAGGGPLPPGGRPAGAPCQRRGGAGDWERVAVEGYPLGDLAPWRPGVLFDTRVLASPLRLWVGYADERPVGADASYVAHGLHILALGVVLPEARRRGYWQPLLRARLADLQGLPSAGLVRAMSRAGAGAERFP